MLHHSYWAYEKSSNYVGCEDTVRRALDIIFSSTDEKDRQPNDQTVGSPLSGIKLCIVGRSGTMPKQGGNSFGHRHANIINIIRINVMFI